MFDEIKDKRYIKMCNCPEVQEYRKEFEEGDILVNHYLRWVQVDKDTQKAQRVFCEIVIFDKLSSVEDRDLVVWLPRQSDIQDMLGYDFPFMARQFAIYVEDDIEPEKFGSVFKTWCESMHEFWLVIYMREIHKKTWFEGKWKNIKHWNGMKWVNVKPKKRERVFVDNE